MKIDDSLYLANKTDTANKPNDVLGKDDFLKLLITQLKNQDPMAPMQDKEFISQMASFTSLEQTKNMNDMIAKFVNSQSQNMLSSQSTMIGKAITWKEQITDADGNTTSNQHEGVVSAVTLKDGAVQYITKDGQNVLSADILTISQNS
jgi:flagellar basal-body rod modification protein FlgD